MNTTQRIEVRAWTPLKILLARETAQRLREPMTQAMRSAEVGELEIDYRGVEGMGPSFVDELLAVVEELITDRARSRVHIVFTHPPARLSLKFTAVGRGRGYTAAERGDGSWILTPVRSDS